MARALLLALLSAALAVGVASADEAPVTTQDADVVPADVFPPLGFFPQAGVPWSVLFLARFVDLDPAPGDGKDFDCGSQVYDGHGGEDSLVRSFREHAIAHG